MQCIVCLFCRRVYTENITTRDLQGMKNQVPELGELLLTAVMSSLAGPSSISLSQKSPAARHDFSPLRSFAIDSCPGSVLSAVTARFNLLSIVLYLFPVTPFASVDNF